MNKKWITHYNSVLTAGLAALGFTSCNGWGGQSVEYGTPTVSYHVTGQVTDEAGNPIPGIKVKVVDPYDFDRAANGKPDSTFPTPKESMSPSSTAPSLSMKPSSR